MYALEKLIQQKKISAEEAAEGIAVDITPSAEFWIGTKPRLLYEHEYTPDLWLEPDELHDPTDEASQEEQERDYKKVLRQFPIPLPPFPKMWMEYRAPSYSEMFSRYKNIHCISHTDDLYAKAIFVSASTLSIKGEQPHNFLVSSIFKHMLSFRYENNPSEWAKRGEEEYPPARKAVGFVDDHVLAAYDNGCRPAWATVWSIGELTKAITIENHFLKEDTPWNPDFGIIFHDDAGGIIPKLTFAMNREQISIRIPSRLYPFLFATSLMHAKNVELVDLPGPPPKIAKRRKREGKPVITFKTLNIHPIRKQYPEREEKESGDKRSFHIVRGHFKDFREKGLFGSDKHKGIYWWDMHTAGDADIGIVAKDYKVKP